MRLALLADIHGNAHALSAVLSAARQEGVQRLLCAGDFVGYYYQPDACLDLLSDWQVDAVRGNHDVMLAELIEQPSLAAELRARYGSGLEVAASVLTPDRLAALAALPVQRRITMDAMSILLCHGTPWDTNTYVYPDADESVFRRCAESGADIVVMGHTHHRLDLRRGNARLLNPGSVGQPRDRTPGAAWGLLDTDTGAYHQRIEQYDSEPVKSRARALDPHLPYLWEVLDRR